MMVLSMGRKGEIRGRYITRVQDTQFILLETRITKNDYYLTETFKQNIQSVSLEITEGSSCGSVIGMLTLRERPLKSAPLNREIASVLRPRPRTHRIRNPWGDPSHGRTPDEYSSRSERVENPYPAWQWPVCFPAPPRI